VASLEFQTSVVNTSPSGSRIHPSSSLKLSPALPVGMKGALKVGGLVLAFKVATWLLKGLAIINVPSARTADCASPISVHPEGGAIQVQLFATGS
jgi:hypothetical protein